MRSVLFIYLFAALAGIFFYGLDDQFTSGDVVGTTLTPVVILTRGDISLDAFVPHYRKANSGEFPYFLHSTPHGVISTYPLATALLATPIYALPVFYFEASRHPTAEDWIIIAFRLGKFSAVVFAALAIVVFWKITRRLGASPNVAVWLTIAFAFGSELLVHGSQALWMHGPGVLFLLLAVYCCLESDASRLQPWMIGLTCGIAVCIRPTNLLLVGPLWIWLVLKKPSTALLAALPGGMLAIALCWYNKIFFGQLSGSYPVNYPTPLTDGLSGILVSPGSGLLIFFPIAIFGFWGIFRGWKESSRSIYPVFAVFIGSSLLLIAKWFAWHGGHCYGPRLLSEIQPFLLLGCIPLAARLEEPAVRRWWQWPVIGLIGWSCFVQILGGYFCGHGRWTIFPSNVDTHTRRLWNWRDSPIQRCWSAAIQEFRQPPGIRLTKPRADYQIAETSLQIDSGQTYYLTVKVKNRGHEPWNRWLGPGSVNLGYRILDSSGQVQFVGMNRALFSGATASGKSATVLLPVDAPVKRGHYQIEISLLQNSQSFANRGAAPLLIPLNVF